MQCLSKQRAAQTRPAARVERRIVGCTAGRTSHTPCRDLKPETLSLEHCRTPSAQNPDAAEGGCHVHQFAACVGSPRTQDCRSGQACNLLLLLLLLLRLQLYLRLPLERLLQPQLQLHLLLLLLPVPTAAAVAATATANATAATGAAAAIATATPTATATAAAAATATAAAATILF